jgi:hypothetical protein
MWQSIPHHGRRGLPVKPLNKGLCSKRAASETRRCLSQTCAWRGGCRPLPYAFHPDPPFPPPSDTITKRLSPQVATVRKSIGSCFHERSSRLSICTEWRCQNMPRLPHMIVAQMHASSRRQRGIVHDAPPNLRGSAVSPYGRNRTWRFAGNIRSNRAFWGFNTVPQKRRAPMSKYHWQMVQCLQNAPLEIMVGATISAIRRPLLPKTSPIQP